MSACVAIKKTTFLSVWFVHWNFWSQIYQEQRILQPSDARSWPINIGADSNFSGLSSPDEEINHRGGQIIANQPIYPIPPQNVASESLAGFPQIKYSIQWNINTPDWDRPLLN